MNPAQAQTGPQKATAEHALDDVRDELGGLTLDGSVDVAGEVARLQTLALGPDDRRDDIEMLDTEATSDKANQKVPDTVVAELAEKELPGSLTNLHLGGEPTSGDRDRVFPRPPPRAKAVFAASRNVNPAENSADGAGPSLRQRQAPSGLSGSPKSPTSPETPTSPVSPSQSTRPSSLNPSVSSSFSTPLFNRPAPRAPSRPQFPLLSLPAHNPPNISSLSYILGIVSGFGLGLVAVSVLVPDMEGYGPIGMWLAVLGSFHEGEYLGAATWRPNEVSINCEFLSCAIVHFGRLTLCSLVARDKAFLINHSTAYHAAAIGAITEYLIEWWLFPSWKCWNTLSFIGSSLPCSRLVFHVANHPLPGLAITALGLTLRNLAVHTLGEHFSHQLSSRPPLKLVTEGIYSVLRHPSYTGFYYYSIGTQILLLNPVCAIGYGYVLGRFFKERVEEEESRLQAMPGWEAYRRSTGVYIPGVD